MTRKQKNRLHLQFVSGCFSQQFDWYLDPRFSLIQQIEQAVSSLAYTERMLMAISSKYSIHSLESTSRCLPCKGIQLRATVLGPHHHQQVFLLLSDFYSTQLSSRLHCIRFTTCLSASNPCPAFLSEPRLLKRMVSKVLVFQASSTLF